MKGGKRKGAGRKPLYASRTVCIRVPIDILPEIMAMLDSHKLVKPPAPESMPGVVSQNVEGANLKRSMFRPA